MKQEEFNRKLDIIATEGSLPRLVDGFTGLEYEIIIEAIEKQEGAALDSIAILANGMKYTYPGIYAKYHRVFETEES